MFTEWQLNPLPAPVAGGEPAPVSILARLLDEAEVHKELARPRPAEDPAPRPQAFD